MARYGRYPEAYDEPMVERTPLRAVGVVDCGGGQWPKAMAAISIAKQVSSTADNRSEGPHPSDRRATTSRVQESPKFLDEDYATRVVELLQVIGEIGEADLVPRISERYLPAQAIVAEGTLSEERTAF